MFLAQTNLQLLTRMRDDGYPSQDLDAASSAYWLAAEAFSGTVRGSGKPFLCHLVGTAAAAALERPPIHVISAALCHGIFESGDFGELMPSVRDGLIAKRLGPDTVELLTRYAVMQKQRATEVAAVLDTRPDEVPDVDRWSALIWAANEADDEIDAGSRFRCDRSDRDRRKDFSLRLARHFEWRKLEALLVAAYAGYDEADWAEPLAAPYTASVTFAWRTPQPQPSALKQLYRSLGRRLRWARLMKSRQLVAAGTHSP